MIKTATKPIDTKISHLLFSPTGIYLFSCTNCVLQSLILDIHILYIAVGDNVFMIIRKQELSYDTKHCVNGC